MIETESPRTRTNGLAVMLLIALILFFLLEFVGGYGIPFGGPILMDNALCFRFLGCNAGFFGYDALVHFSGGVLEAAFILWAAEKWLRHDFFHENDAYERWKNWIVLLAILAFIAWGWELGEFCFDKYRTIVLHQHLFTAAYNHLAQPSNADTMGDTTFGIIGGLFCGLAARLLALTKKL